MKRSRSIELALMGGVPLLLAGCGGAQAPGQTALMYEDVQQCISDGQVPPVNCEESYERSLLAEQNAPRYSTLTECEAEYGESQCRPAQGGGSWFVPMAAGFLIARALDDHGHYYDYSGGWYGAAGWYSQPIYRLRGESGAWRTLSGQRFGAGAGAGPHTVAETLSRGGFGRTSAARFSWGG